MTYTLPLANAVAASGLPPFRFRRWLMRQARTTRVVHWRGRPWLIWRGPSRKSADVIRFCPNKKRAARRQTGKPSDSRIGPCGEADRRSIGSARTHTDHA